MPVDVLVGMQWGDEGKGKALDVLGPYDWVVRMNGGPNAGHSVAETKVHQVPAGLGTKAALVIAPGSVVNVPELILEIDRLEGEGFDVARRLFVSDRAHVITVDHLMRDTHEEQGRAGQKIGTTRRGNGPVHADKYARTGVRLRSEPDQMDWSGMLRRRGVYVGDVGGFLQDAVMRGQRILLLVAHGTMLDIDHGTYPFVTSSHCTTAGAFVGSGLAPSLLRSGTVWGVVKAFTTRVAPGPMRGELTGSLAELIREEGKEFGTTTGRPRRIGWIDLGQLRYAAEINRPDLLLLTKVDTLAGLDRIGVITSEWDEREATMEAEWLPGWGKVDYDGPLPEGLRRLVDLVERYTYARVAGIGLGPAAHEIRWIGPRERIL